MFIGLIQIFCSSCYPYSLEFEAKVCQGDSCLWVSLKLIFRLASDIQKSKTFLYKFLTSPKENVSIILEKTPPELFALG